VYGGRYGNYQADGAVWQFLLMDSSFEGQSEAAIHTMEVGFTLIRVRFAHMPIAIQIAPEKWSSCMVATLQMGGHPHSGDQARQCAKSSFGVT